MTKQEAWEIYLAHRPSTMTEQEYFEAGWAAAMEAAANAVFDFMDVTSYVRAQTVIWELA